MENLVFLIKLFTIICFLNYSVSQNTEIFSLLRLKNFTNFDVKNWTKLPENLNKISWPDLGNIICGNLGGKDISPQCRRQMDVVCVNPGLLLQMADAWSKFPYTGLSVRSRLDLGTYDQCINIDHRFGAVRVLGKHCTGGLLIPTKLPSEAVDISEVISTAFKLSYCVPSSCNSQDVFKIIGFVPSELVNDALCTTKEDDSKLNGGSVAILVIFIFIFGVIILSTIYDLALHANKQENNYPLFTAFSFYTNTQKLFKTSPISTTNKEQIMVFHGLKLISMLWIVAGHFAAGFAPLPVTNDAKVKNFLMERYSQYIGTAHLAVDTFFFISGFLMAYQYFRKEAYKPIRSQVLNVPLLIFQRYLRLTPALLMFYLYAIGLHKYTVDGPLRPYEKQLRQSCLDNWYAVFLYIQNYYNRHDLCMTSLWYVSADMQLFLLAPFIMIPIAYIVKSKLFKTAFTSLCMINLCFLVLPIFTKLMFRNYDPNYDEFDTHSRLIDYFIGFTFGFYIRHKRDKIFIFDSWMNTFLWILTLGGMLGVVLVLQEINMNHGYVAKALCYSFMRPAWCLGLCWIVYSCINGKGGVINSILSNGFMQVGGKLTYAMYLVHGVIIMQWSLSTRTSRYFSDLEMFYLSSGIFVMTWVVATFWSLAFESPIIIITKVLLGGRGGRAPRAETTNGQITPYKTNIPPPPPPMRP